MAPSKRVGTDGFPTTTPWGRARILLRYATFGNRAFRVVWRVRWLLAMNLFLISPVLLYELGIGRQGPDRTLLFVLPASVLTLVAAQLVLRSVWLTHILLAPLYLSTAIDLFVITHYQTRLGSSTLLVILENVGGASEYLRAHLFDVASWLAMLLAAYAFGLSRLRSLKMRLPRVALFGALAAVVSFYAVVERHIGLLGIFLANDRSSPFGLFSQSYIASVVYRAESLQAEASKGFSFGALRTQVPSEAEAYILVIGESSRPDHWGIYGYKRDTTPRLAKTDNIVVFRNVVSQSALTKLSVPLILTRGVVEDPARAAREKSIVSAFREVGFSTYWLSTQQRDPYTGAINRYSSEAESERFFERRHDGILVEQAARILADASEKRLFLVIHTLGSHYTYESRYENEFEVFSTRRGTASGRQRLINAYDNTVLYSDFVIAQLIGALRSRPGIKALLYVSDHGENLEDDDRKLYGHFINNEYDLPIPMLVWYSEEFSHAFPQKVSSLSENARKPINTRTVFYSLLDVAGITVGDPATNTLSVFSSQLSISPRMVSKEPRPVDFDRWLVDQGIQVTSLCPGP
jgi:glucan phosphoethanolaminetransferase (alkaline phosphatase superfamily)